MASSRPTPSPVAVFGANGFVGSYLTQSLLAEGHSVLAFARTGSSFCFPVEGEKLVIVDPAAEDDVQTFLRHHGTPEIFFHLAANVNVGAALEGPEAFIAGNLQLTAKALELAQKNCPKASVVLLSSDRVFGPATGTVTEDSPKGALDPYGASKSQSEDMFVSAWPSEKLTIVRASNLYGPFQRSNQFLPSVFRKFWRGENAITVGNLEVKRNFLHVSDLNEGLMGIVRQSKDLKPAVHFGSRHSSLTEVTQIFTRVAEDMFKRKVEFIGQAGRPAQNELGSFDLNCELANRWLNWQPKLNLEQGLITVFKQEGKANGFL